MGAREARHGTWVGPSTCVSLREGSVRVREKESLLSTLPAHAGADSSPLSHPCMMHMVHRSRLSALRMFTRGESTVAPQDTWSAAQCSRCPYQVRTYLPTACTLCMRSFGVAVTRALWRRSMLLLTRGRDRVRMLTLCESSAYHAYRLLTTLVNRSAGYRHCIPSASTRHARPVSEIHLFG